MNNRGYNVILDTPLPIPSLPAIDGHYIQAALYVLIIVGCAWWLWYSFPLFRFVGNMLLWLIWLPFKVLGFVIGLRRRFSPEEEETFSPLPERRLLRWRNK